MRRLPLLIAVGGAVVVVACGGLRFVDPAGLAERASALRAALLAWAWLAPPAFIAATALALMVLVVPAWFCTLAAGVLFGTALGAVYALLGVTLGAMAVFGMARAGLVGLKLDGDLAARVAAELRAGALLYVVAFRLVPVFPFTLVNVVAAAAGVPLHRFALGTLIGIIPSTLIYASFGDLLIDLARRGEALDIDLVRRPRFVLPLLALALLAVSPMLLRRFRSRRD
jgi:uncharacterized membrane protein YdjX (TVP38/TMEM64 family)